MMEGTLTGRQAYNTTLTLSGRGGGKTQEDTLLATLLHLQQIFTGQSCMEGSQ